MYFEALQRYFDRPRPGLPYRRPAEYGATLAGVIVKYTAEADVARTLGAPVHVIPNGVPLPAPRPPRAPDGRLILGTAARISTQKKLEELLAALRLVTPHLPAHVLRIAGGVERGSETYAAELRHLAEGLSVEWVGETQAIDEFLAGLDVFVQVSEPAGCPNASLEALAAGLPVIATDVGGASEQVVDGVTGYLTPRGDPAVLASAMLELARDAGRRASFGAAGRAHIAAYFSLPRMVDDYRRICLSSR
jgi:glycosyltransferase involved in cell wall biosynthesis